MEVIMYIYAETRQSGQLPHCSQSNYVKFHLHLFVIRYLQIHSGRNNTTVPCGDTLHILEDSVSVHQTLAALCRGKYFANSHPFRGGRVSINVIILVEFVCQKICEYLLINKLYRKHAFVCLLGKYYNPSVPKWTKCGNQLKLQFRDSVEFIVS